MRKRKALRRKRAGRFGGKGKRAGLSRVTRRRTAAPIARWNPDPEDVERSVARLVLALVEFIRKLLERQAVRRMEKGTLSRREVESLGLALMRLERTVYRMASRFGLSPADLNLDLGPVGRLS